MSEPVVEGGVGAPRPLGDPQGERHGEGQGGAQGDPYGAPASGMHGGLFGDPQGGAHGPPPGGGGLHVPPPGMAPMGPPGPMSGPVKPKPSMRPVLGLVALSVLSAGICAGVVMYLRNRVVTGGETSAEAPAASAGDPTTPEMKAMRAVVTLPEGQPRGVLRQKPAFDAPVVVMLPVGTSVEVTNSTAVQGQTWYRVRTVDYQPAASGWMHGGILKMN